LPVWPLFENPAKALPYKRVIVTEQDRELRHGLLEQED